jgi:hypothetical protein
VLDFVHFTDNVKFLLGFGIVSVPALKNECDAFRIRGAAYSNIAQNPVDDDVKVKAKV